MKYVIPVFLLFLSTLFLSTISFTSEAATGFQFIVGENWYPQRKEKFIVHADIRINDLRIRHIENIGLTNLGGKWKKCKRGKREGLEIVGPINPDTHEVVKRLLQNFDTCYTTVKVAPVIMMDSGGGYLKDGFELGRTLRKYGSQTVIVRGAMCASSCAAAFLGGRYRYLDERGKIMFHAPYKVTGYSSVSRKMDIACQKKNEDLKNYFRGMLGGSDGNYLYDRTMSYCSTSSGWTLNKDAARLFNIHNNKF